MDCNFILQNDIYEKYLLNYLSDADKVKFEQHLQDCKDCQKKLQRERNFIAGIQNIGREELKSEIRQQTEILETKKSIPNWGLITKVAAVLVFAVFTTQIIYKTQIDVPDQLIPNLEIEQIISTEDLDSAETVVIFQDLNVEPKGEHAPKSQESNEDKSTNTGKDNTNVLSKISTEKKSLQIGQKDESKIPKAKSLATQPDELAIISTEGDRLILGAREKQDLTVDNVTSLSPSLATKSEPLNQEISIEKQGGISYRIQTDRANEETQSFSFTPLRKNSRSSMKVYKTIGLENNITHDHLKDLKFQDKQKSILAHLVLEESKDTKGFPNSFKVDILVQNNQQLEMIFYVPSSLFEFDKDKIQVNFSQDQTLEVLFKEREYRIDLNRNPAEAVLVQ